MYKFYENNSFTSYIKNLLLDTRLPVYNFVKAGDFLIAGCYYIYNGNLIKCTESGIMGNDITLEEQLRKEQGYKYILECGGYWIVEHNTIIDFYIPSPEEFPNKLIIPDNVNGTQITCLDTTFSCHYGPSIEERPGELSDAAKSGKLAKRIQEVFIGPGINLLKYRDSLKKDPDHDNATYSVFGVHGDLNAGLNALTCSNFKVVYLSKTTKLDNTGCGVFENCYHLTTQIKYIKECKYEFLKSYQLFKTEDTEMYNFVSKTNYYDYQTHKYLGEYLRRYRDVSGINLMPFYNCFMPKTEDKLYIDETGALKEIFPTTYINTVLYIVPIKFNTEYTIALETLGRVKLKPMLFSNEGRIRKPQQLQIIKLFDLGEKINDTDDIISVSVGEYTNVPFSVLEYGNTFVSLLYNYKPSLKVTIVYNDGVESKEYVFVTELDNLLNNESGYLDEDFPYEYTDTISFHLPYLWKFNLSYLYALYSEDPNRDELLSSIYHQEDNLYLLLLVNKEDTSSIVVLEGDYTTRTQPVHWQKDINEKEYKNLQPYIVSHDTSVSSDNYDFISCPSLLLLGTGEDDNLPFSNRLVEYLLENVIDSNEYIGENILNVLKYINYDHLDGIWDNILQTTLYSEYMNSNGRFLYKWDITGFVDKDVERYIERSGKK